VAVCRIVLHIQDVIHTVRNHRAGVQRATRGCRSKVPRNIYPRSTLSIPDQRFLACECTRVETRATRPSGQTSLPNPVPAGGHFRMPSFPVRSHAQLCTSGCTCGSITVPPHATQVKQTGYRSPSQPRTTSDTYHSRRSSSESPDRSPSSDLRGIQLSKQIPSSASPMRRADRLKVRNFRRDQRYLALDRACSVLCVLTDGKHDDDYVRPRTTAAFLQRPRGETSHPSAPRRVDGRSRRHHVSETRRVTPDT